MGRHLPILRWPSQRVLWLVGIGVSLVAAVASALHAPTAVWIAFGAVVVIVLLVAGVLHITETPREEVSPPTTLDAEYRVSTQALAYDARNHADELLRFREDLRFRLAHAIEQEEGTVRSAYERQFESDGLAARSQEMYERGREWGFFHPAKDRRIFGPSPNMGGIRQRAERLCEFADCLERELALKT